MPSGGVHPITKNTNFRVRPALARKCIPSRFEFLEGASRERLCGFFPFVFFVWFVVIFLPWQFRNESRHSLTR